MLGNLMSNSRCLAVIVFTVLINSSNSSGSFDYAPIPPSPCEQGAALSYDDGTACWLTWEGNYRGVWFHLPDFGPSFECSFTEFWFYHEVTYHNWDVSTFYAELWLGGSGPGGGPETQLDETAMIATHYSPAISYYSAPFTIDEDLWVVCDLSLSAGGWPSSMLDSTGNEDMHSFFSSDFFVWEPMCPPNGPNGVDAIIRAGGTLGLNSTTWAAIKAIF